MTPEFMRIYTSKQPVFTVDESAFIQLSPVFGSYDKFLVCGQANTSILRISVFLYRDMCNIYIYLNVVR